MSIKNSISTLLLVLSSILLVSSCATNSTKVTLKGEVIDRPQSNLLILYKASGDPRVDAVKIPIVNGKFEYVLNYEHEELYELLFEEEFERGSVIPVPFFSEPGIINFTLYPEDRFRENNVKGGKSNDEYWNYWNSIMDKLQAVDLEVKQSNVDEIEKQKMWQTVFREKNLFTLQYIKEHPTIVGYSILAIEVDHAIQRNQFVEEGVLVGGEIIDISPYVELYQTVFAPKFHDHPYTEQMENLLASLSIEAGVPFVDFTAVDFNGNPVKLSERISGKPSVLHLWASWCGPCQRKGVELIPVYEEFRDKGFVVIGVAREKDVTDAKSAIERHKFPWENLVELKDIGKIWEKYGVRGGGAIFLIDENGIIVANDPSIEEIRDFLTNNL